MHRHAHAALLLAIVASSAVTAAPGYVPAPVYCADSSVTTLCSIVPSFLGPDPAIGQAEGYQGLSTAVTSLSNDAQTPFDNMAWQMFLALNWQASQAGGSPDTGLAGDGTAVWQTWAHPEDVFGGLAGNCPNPDNLQRFNIIAKSGAHPRDEEFMQATGQPLIDVAGNWTLFERRMNAVEQAYIVQSGLDSLAGQQIFARGGKTVQFPSGDPSRPDGAVGAMEIKASWRIVGDAEAPKYFTTRGLIDVQGEYVADGQPLCETVTLGLVGMHITQNNVQSGVLKAQLIWASFEHQDNAPLATNACAATDANCYKTIAKASSPTSPNVCPADGSGGAYAYFNAACSDVVTNTPPVPASKGGTFLWQRTMPFAGLYTITQGDAVCGTQVSRCWDVYTLTQQLNTQWQQQLTDIGSVFANYSLIGTNWGGAIEFLPGGVNNGSVPAFLANSTMETYIQADPKHGNCVGCHAQASLAYRETKTSPKIPADFSFLLSLADASCSDADAGPIWNTADAQATCPVVCTGYALAWNGQWTTTVPGTQSVCGCCLTPDVAEAHAKRR